MGMPTSNPDPPAEDIRWYATAGKSLMRFSLYTLVQFVKPLSILLPFHFRPTHNLTQNRKKSSGDNGAKRLGAHFTPGRKAPETAGNIQTIPQSAAHNPEVAGSSPVSATKKVLKP